MTRQVRVETREPGLIAAHFDAMACPCEVILETEDSRLAECLGRNVAAEAWRIEDKFSRYLTDSVVGRINSNGGRSFTVDAETSVLIDFAARCHALSDGAFDITSGVLRRVWRFDGSNVTPTPDAIEEVLVNVGFDRLTWVSPQLTVPAGMEIDLGGIGKEYAVDRALALVSAEAPGATLVNFGGDLAASHPPKSGNWRVGVEQPDRPGEPRLLLEFSRGGLATSGDAHRSILIDGVRYGHILDVRTGWPVKNAPRSVSVAAGTCVEAGMLATLAMLKGNAAEQFLTDEGVAHWCLR